MNEYSIFHGLIGCVAVALAAMFHVNPQAAFWIVTVLGIAHELLDGDMWQKTGIGRWPWYLPLGYEGWKDVFSFLVPGPVLYVLVAHFLRP